MTPGTVLDAAPSLSTGKRAALDKHVISVIIDRRIRFSEKFCVRRMRTRDRSDRCPGCERYAQRPCEYHRNDFPKLARYPFEFDFAPPADGVVRHIGEGAAAVAAQTPEQALDAIAAINLSLFGSRLVTECDITGSGSGVSYRGRSPKPHAASGAL